MPRLADDVASKVEQAGGETGSFNPLEPGLYRARLIECTAGKSRSSGKPMWTWTFECVDEGVTGRRLWVNTVIDDTSFWKVAEIFSAFGVPSSTDTDDLMSCTAVLKVSQRVIKGGSRDGEMGNNVDRIMRDEDDDAVLAPGADWSGGSKDKVQDKPKGNTVRRSSGSADEY